MKFPSYIPSAIRKQVEWYLEGNEKRGWEGWNACLEKGTLDESRKRDMECMTRLVEDGRMRRVYESLSEFTDEQWDLFFKAAWAANNDYSEIREIHLTANKKIKEIGEKALELSRLLDEVISPRGDFPGELFHTHSLLKESENRHHWMGDIVLTGNEATPQIAKDVMHYVWRKAPTPSALLKIMAHAAFNYKPVEELSFPHIDQAIYSRKKNPKTAYIRAFKALLTEYGINYNSPKIINAIAITVAVVLNDPDIDISYDDIRKT